jgi:hypothetical protein
MDTTDLDLMYHPSQLLPIILVSDRVTVIRSAQLTQRSKTRAPSWLPLSCLEAFHAHHQASTRAHDDHRHLAGHRLQPFIVLPGRGRGQDRHCSG